MRHSPQNPENQAILHAIIKMSNREVMEPAKIQERNRRHFRRALCKLKLCAQGECPRAGAASLGWEEKYKGWDPQPRQLGGASLLLSQRPWEMPSDRCPEPLSPPVHIKSILLWLSTATKKTCESHVVPQGQSCHGGIDPHLKNGLPLPYVIPAVPWW